MGAARVIHACVGGSESSEMRQGGGDPRQQPRSCFFEVAVGYVEASERGEARHDAVHAGDEVGRQLAVTEGKMGDGRRVAGHVESVDEFKLQLLCRVEVDAVHLQLTQAISGLRRGFGHDVREQRPHGLQG